MKVVLIPVDQVFEIFVSLTKKVHKIGVTDNNLLVIEYEEYGVYKIITLPKPPEDES